MSERSLGIKIAKTFGEKIIKVLSKLELLNRKLKIKHEEDYLIIPIVREPNLNEVKEIKRLVQNFSLIECDFEVLIHKKTIIDFLKDVLPHNLLNLVPRSMDLIGDIAIIELPEELEKYGKAIGEAIMHVHRNIRLVLAKIGPVSGEYRIRSFKVLAGSGGTETMHKEHGCIYYLDVTKVYFSPRLSYERWRVANQVSEGEIVIDMFAGVGPFSILIAKMHKNVKVYAIDINPEAIKYLKINIKANKVERKVFPIHGDAAEVIRKKLIGVGDRVIMNLPEKALEYIDAACKALKDEEGVIHYYEFSSESLNETSKRVISAIEKSGRRVLRVLQVRRVKAVAPYKWQVAVDVLVK